MKAIIQSFYDLYEPALVKKFIPLILNYKRYLFSSIICMLFFSVLNIIPAVYIKNVIDALNSNEKIPYIEFVLLGGGLFGLFLLKGCFQYGQQFLMGTLTSKIVSDIKTNLFDKVIYLPFEFFNKRHAGDLISRIANDTSSIASSVTTAVVGPLRDFPQIIFLIAIMIYRSWHLFILTSFMIPLIMFFIHRLSQKNKVIRKFMQEQNGRITSNLVESIGGIRVIKTFTMEEYEIKKYRRNIMDLLKATIKAIRISSYSVPVIEMLGAIFGALIFCVGGFLINEEIITSGDMASFLLAFFMLNQPFKNLNTFSLNIQTGIVSARRVMEIQEIFNPIMFSSNTRQLSLFSKNLRINIKKFSYEKENVLENINISIKKNQIVAFVGESGSGKTTLSNLIPRFFDIPCDDGIITIDGYDIRNVDVISLRKQISVVSQDVLLFADTIANNIRYGKNNCTHEEIITAAKNSYAHQFIQSLPNGYDEYIGERGIRLSGGQKQRIAIARAFIKDAPLIILDEATSSLDTISEKEVQDALENLMVRKTVIIIAHRLSTIRNANIIYVMKNGRIIEQGNHEHLISNKSEYRKLYDIQVNENI